jgi:hypothetical protein
VSSAFQSLLSVLSSAAVERFHKDIFPRTPSAFKNELWVYECECSNVQSALLNNGTRSHSLSLCHTAIKGAFGFICNFVCVSHKKHKTGLHALAAAV